MSKHKKRVSLGERPAELAPEVERRTPPAAAPLIMTGVTVAEDIEERELAVEAIEAAPESPAVLEAAEAGDGRVGIESHPLFWFLLGALTVGIIVLVGLLLMTPAKAAPAAALRTATLPAATAPAVRAATSTPLSAAAAAAEATAADVQAVMTAVMEQNESVPHVSLAYTKEKLDAGTAIVVDVRVAGGYDLKHIKGAINVPELEIESRLSQLPKGKEIILYCS